MKILSEQKKSKLIKLLELRFKDNMSRHKNFKWAEIKDRLDLNEKALWSLSEMEKTGGEPDVVAYDREMDKYIFIDCSSESPVGRRSFCYDHEALQSRKENKPKNSVKNLAIKMGVEILDEAQYRNLQSLGEFDLKSSSWLKTPENIRNLGGAIFADRRYNTVFVYHNGAESYYASRGFRSMLFL